MTKLDQSMLQHLSAATYIRILYNGVLFFFPSQEQLYYFIPYLVVFSITVALEVFITIYRLAIGVNFAVLFPGYLAVVRKYNASIFTENLTFLTNIRNTREVEKINERFGRFLYI